MRVAETILEQLGGSRFRAMTGAHNAIALDDGLQIQFKGSRKANSMRVKLNALDTYDVSFYKIRGVDFKEVESFDGIYAMDLRRIFEDVTGLATSL